MVLEPKFAGKMACHKKCLSLCLVRVGLGWIFGSRCLGWANSYIYTCTYKLQVFFFVAPLNLPKLWGRETGSGLVEVGGVLHGLVRLVPLRGVRYAVPPVYCRLWNTYKAVNIGSWGLAHRHLTLSIFLVLKINILYLILLSNY